MSEPFKPVSDQINYCAIVDGSFIPRHVVCAANRFENGVILCGARHWDEIMRRQSDAMGCDDWQQAEQGFIDQWGNWMTREEAAFVVKANGQKLRFPKMHDEGCLYSEDLY